MGHFALSMLILARRGGARLARLARADVASAEPGDRALRNGSASRAGSRRHRDRTLILAVRALVALGALTIFAGTAATAAGPHAGGSPGQRINRLTSTGGARWTS